MPQPAKQAVTELTVTGRLMALDAGAYCVFHAPGTAAADAESGFPGVHIAVPPAANGYSGTVELAGFADGGWLIGSDDAALVRIVGGPAQVLVTIYEMPGAAQKPPQLQVIRLTPDAPAPVVAPPPPAPATPEISAHVYGQGDVPGRIGAWVGERGSKRWIEGFGLAPQNGITPADIEYQAVLGRDWMSPWSEGGQFCGSRGMSLPLLGLRIRLRGAAAQTLTVQVEGTFVDGTAMAPVAEGALLQASSLAALEAFRVIIMPRAAIATNPVPAKPVSAKPAPAKAKPTAKAQESKLKTKTVAAPEVPAPAASKKAPPKRTPATTRRR